MPEQLPELAMLCPDAVIERKLQWLVWFSRAPSRRPRALFPGTRGAAFLRADRGKAAPEFLAAATLLTGLSAHIHGRGFSAPRAAAVPGARVRLAERCGV